MKKVHVLKNPTRVTDLNSLDELDDLYDASNWQIKAQKLLSRRERELRRQDAW